MHALSSLWFDLAPKLARHVIATDAYRNGTIGVGAEHFSNGLPCLDFGAVSVRREWMRLGNEDAIFHVHAKVIGLKWRCELLSDAEHHSLLR